MSTAARPLALAAVLAAGCAGSRETGPLRAADPAQAQEGAPAVAQAEVGRVAVRAKLGDWRGQPRDLELRLTPVDVTLANGGARAIRVGPEAFRLVTSTGAALRVMTQDEVSAALRGLSGFRPRPAPQTGAVGGPTFPGYDPADPYGPRSGAPSNAPVPPPGAWYPSQLPSGTLASGRQTSMLLFFDTSARSLAGATFVVEVVDDAGTPVGTARLAFARE